MNENHKKWCASFKTYIILCPDASYSVKGLSCSLLHEEAGDI
jgi:hypothetical protein